MRISRKLELHIRKDKQLNKIYSRELLDFLFIRPFYSISKLENYLWVHRNTASTYLNLLEKKWLLKSIKVKKNKIFYYKEFLDILE